jgi:hypothetical protein
MAEHDAEISFTVEGYEKFGDVARVIGRVDRNFPKWIQEEIEREAKQLQREAKKSIRAQRGSGKKQTGILNVIAEGIELEPHENGDEFGTEIRTHMPEENEENLPGGFDTSFGGFWHPLFATSRTFRRDKRGKFSGTQWNTKWYHQEGRYDWWVRVMDKAEPETTPKLEAVLERGADEIAKSAQEKD